MGKGENAVNQHFLLFPQCFLTLSKKEIIILATFNFSSANAFNLVTSKILLFGKELTLSQTSPGFTCLRYKSFENTVEKEEIAQIEQFLLFPQCFLPV